MCIQPFVAQYVASKMLFVDFISFPEQAPTALGDADVTRRYASLLSADTLSTSMTRLCL